MAKKINILVVEPGQPPRPAQVEATLKTFEKVVGGPVEIGCFLPQRVLLIGQEDGKQRGLPPNRENPQEGDYIAGTFICVAIYAVLIGQIGNAGNIHIAIWQCAGYTVLLCFSLFKTGAISKSIFNAH